MEFTEGDMSMLPKLIEFGKLNNTTNEWEEKQKKLNAYLEPALKSIFPGLVLIHLRGRNMIDAIQVHGLTKSYGEHMVLKGLDFQIAQGEVFSCSV